MHEKLATRQCGTSACALPKILPFRIHQHSTCFSTVDSSHLFNPSNRCDEQAHSKWNFRLIRRSPLSTVNLYGFLCIFLLLDYFRIILPCCKIKQNAQAENKLVTAKQAGQRPPTSIPLADPESLYVEDPLEMTEDGFEEDSVAYTTEWESDNEDAVNRHPSAQRVVPSLYILGFQELA